MLLIHVPSLINRSDQEVFMGSTPQVSYIDIRIPHAVTEQEFLRLAVQAAARKFRELRADTSSAVRRFDAEIIATSVQTG
jgi:hypothetical protein